MSGREPDLDAALDIDAGGDPRLERELRELLHRRDAGAAPYPLRGRIDRIPDETPLAGARRIARIGPWLAAAAVILVVVALGGPRLAGTAGSSPPPAAVAAFDPLVRGVGFVGPRDNSLLASALAAAMLLLGVAAIPLAGRRRLLPIALIVAIAGYTATSQAPVSLSTSTMQGPGLHIVEAVMATGSDKDVWYNVAAPGEPFSVGFRVLNEGPLPVRIDGLIPSITDDSDTYYRWTALWVDGEPDGGSTGAAYPFTSRELAPGEGVMLWFVGIADHCAAGSGMTLEELQGGRAYGWTSTPVTLQTSVLGWSHAVTLEFPVVLVTPSTESCDPIPATDRPASPAP